MFVQQSNELLLKRPLLMMLLLIIDVGDCPLRGLVELLAPRIWGQKLNHK